MNVISSNFNNCIHPNAGPHVGRGLCEKPAKVNSLATSGEHIVEHYERDDEGEDAGEGGVVVLPIADGRVGGRLAGHHPGGPSDSAIIWEVKYGAFSPKKM